MIRRVVLNVILLTALVLAGSAAAGTDTCDTDDQLLESAPVTDEMVSIVASGVMASAGALSVYLDDGVSETLWGSIEEFSTPTVVPEGTTAVVLRCDDPTEYEPETDVEWLFAFSAVVGVPCSPDCDLNDVVTGLAQLSDQAHATGAFLFGVSVLVAVWLSGVSVLAFLGWRRARG